MLNPRVLFGLLTAMLFCATAAAQSGVGICPDSIYVFQHNDLEFQFEIPGTDPGTTVNWNFGNGESVSDDSTVVHVFEEGTWTITTIFMDNDCPWDGPTVLSTTINVSPCWMELSAVEIENGLFTVSAIGYPEKYPMHWDMGDGTLITETWVVDHQYSPGTYEACAWIVTDFCYVDTLEACVTINYLPDGIELHEETEVMFYPNPCHDEFYITGDLSLPSTLMLLSIDGRQIQVECDGRRVSTLKIESGIYHVINSTNQQTLGTVIITSK